MCLNTLVCRGCVFVLRMRCTSAAAGGHSSWNGTRRRRQFHRHALPNRGVVIGLLLIPCGTSATTRVKLLCTLALAAADGGSCAAGTLLPPRSTPTSAVLRSLEHVRNARDLAEATDRIAPGRFVFIARACACDC